MEENEDEIFNDLVERAGPIITDVEAGLRESLGDEQFEYARNQARLLDAKNVEAINANIAHTQAQTAITYAHVGYRKALTFLTLQAGRLISFAIVLGLGWSIYFWVK